MAKNEYIERKSLLEQIRLLASRTSLGETTLKSISVEEVLQLILDAPTVGAVEVVHGEWLTTDAAPHHIYCSVCYKTHLANAEWLDALEVPTNYCPNCGARMDGEVSDDGNLTNEDAGKALENLKTKEN